ncbi:hypothetical protein [Halorussus salinisoli]|uniref:hypothetical protein n=1 Tax=Halorussus salinisoli TaxID=2558242 RepID=UPI0010C23C38
MSFRTFILRCRTFFEVIGSSSSTARGQVGIGTLVLFIAALLVAATTVGVLVQITGVLETQSGDTSDDVNQQMTNRVSVVAVTGIVNDSSGTATVNSIEIVTKRGSTSDAVDLSEAIVRISQPNETYTLTYTNGSPTEAATFGVEPLRDPKTTVPVLAQSADRFGVVITTSPLTPNTAVKLKITLQSGTTQLIHITIPRSLEDKTTVPLR